MPSLTATSPVADPSVLRRQALLDTWLESATELAIGSGDPEALQVVGFLTSAALLGLPRTNNDLAYVPRDGVDPAEAVFVVPMIAVDYLLLPTDDYWREFASPAHSTEQTVGLAEFYTPTRAIYLPGEWQRSLVHRGLTLLHEGQHAYDHLIRGEHMPKPFWRRERNAQLMEMRILRWLGGAEFLAYLDSLAPDVERQLGTAKRLDEFNLPPERSEDDLLDRVLWPASSKREREDRRSDIERSAVARYLQQRYGAHGESTHYGKYVRDNYVRAKAHPQHLAGLDGFADSLEP